MKKSKITPEPKPENRGKKGHSVYPWETIPVGHTFFASGHTVDQAQSVLSLIQYYQNKLDKKFSMRTIDDKIKVWRDA
jgi:hypothetical protein